MSLIWSMLLSCLSIEPDITLTFETPSWLKKNIFWKIEIDEKNCQNKQTFDLTAKKLKLRKWEQKLRVMKKLVKTIYLISRETWIVTSLCNRQIPQRFEHWHHHWHTWLCDALLWQSTEKENKIRFFCYAYCTSTYLITATFARPCLWKYVTK